MENSTGLALLGIGIGLFVNLLGLAFSYGMLYAQVKAMRDSLAAWQMTTEGRLAALEQGRTEQAGLIGKIQGRAEQRHPTLT